MNDAPKKTSNAAVRVPILMATALAFIFLTNVVIGKISISQGATQAAGMGDVGEFLVLFAAMVFFVFGCLAKEREKAKEGSSSTNT